MRKKIVEVKRREKKGGKHLKFYRDNVESGKMRRSPDSSYWIDTYPGLCSASHWGKIDNNLLNKYFKPNECEKQKLRKEGKDYAYWGSDSKNERRGVFTPLRQTIVLFMAAIKGEL